jgi:hypothetical protein
MVRFFAEPQRLFVAIEAQEPLPPLSAQPRPVLFAPGLPKLYRAATRDEEAIWETLVGPRAVRELLREGHSQNVIAELLRIGAVARLGVHPLFGGETDFPAAGTKGAKLTTTAVPKPATAGQTSGRHGRAAETACRRHRTTGPASDRKPAPSVALLHKKTGGDDARHLSPFSGPACNGAMVPQPPVCWQRALAPWRQWRAFLPSRSGCLPRSRRKSRSRRYRLNPVLYCSRGLPKLYRAATRDEEAIWETLVGPRAVRKLA